MWYCSRTRNALGTFSIVVIHRSQMHVPIEYCIAYPHLFTMATCVPTLRTQLSGKRQLCEMQAYVKMENFAILKFKLLQNKAH